jgi:isocitrate/isopropylmalate dehydrogenase
MNLTKILVLPGDGVGPVSIASAKKILGLFDSVEILEGQIGHTAYESTGNYLPHETLDLIDETNIILTGPVKTVENVKNPLEALKVQLDIFARGRFYKTLAPDLGLKQIEATVWSSYNNIAREIVEVKDFEGVTLTKYIRNDAYSRMMAIAKQDVDLRGLTNIACLTRSDFFPISSGMFRDAFESTFSDEKYNIRALNVREWMSNVFKDPNHDDCIICVDLYNQIVAGIIAGLAGNRNLYPTVYKGVNYSIYEPNFFSEIEGFDPQEPNPTSAIIATSIILKNLGMDGPADDLMLALVESYAAGDRTSDVGGTLSAEDFTDKVISRL